MTILIALISLSVVGFGAVFWLLKNDKGEKKNSAPVGELKTEDSSDSSNVDGQSSSKSSLLDKMKFFEKKKPEQDDDSAQPKASSSLLKGVLGKLKLGKKELKPNDVPEVTPLPSLKEYLKAEKGENTEKVQEEVDGKPEALTGTKGIKTVSPEDSKEAKPLSQEEEKNIEKEIELTTELKELKEKYDKLDALFSEKSTEFEKSKKSLSHELENRREFNKVKDILEKELKESKDKARNIQGELNNAQVEIVSFKGRNVQLEDKTTKLEKDLLEKEDKISDLVKRMQTFASPSTADTPPVVEGEKKEEGSDPSVSEVLDKSQSATPSQESSTETAPSQETVQKDSSVEPAPASLAVNSDEKSETSQPEKPAEDSTEKKEDGGEVSSKVSEGPSKQAGAFTLNLTDDGEGADKQSKEEEPVKLQPDILSDETQSDQVQQSSSEKENNKPDKPPKKVSDDQGQN